MSYLPVRFLAIVCVCCVLSSIDAFAGPQDPDAVVRTNQADQSQTEVPEQYLITLSQYRLEGLDTSHLTADDVAAAIKTQKASPVETVMLTAVAGGESMVQFGRSVTVTTGTVANRDVTSRQTQQREVGSLLRLIPSTEGQKVGLQLTFESSRQAGEGTDDSPPDIVTISIKISQLFDLGKPTLIGGTTTGESSYVFLTVSRR
jgi:hypothetical protein